MDWRTLVCASCGHPVAEGACPVCRDARQSFLRDQRSVGRELLALVALVLVVVAALAVLHH